MSTKMVRFEILPMVSEYFVCQLVGYNKDDFGIYTCGCISYEEAVKKLKEIVDNY